MPVFFLVICPRFPQYWLHTAGGVFFCEGRAGICSRLTEWGRFEAKPHLGAKLPEGYDWSAGNSGSEWRR